MADNVAYGLNRQGIRGAAARAEVARALDLVELEGFDARRPKQLSGGQQQRVALARAIVTRPRVLLLDEPLSALDRRLRQTMQVELRRIQRDSGLTTIFVTHDQEEALTLSDRVAILDGGRIVQEGAPADGLRAARDALRRDVPGRRQPVRRDGAGRRRRRRRSGRCAAADPLPAEGSAVTLAVRPEKILPLGPGAAAPDGFNTLDATLRQTVYAGATSTFLLAGPGRRRASRCFCQSREAPALEPGAEVRLAWSPAHTVVLGG